jgi:hypothetical protein
VSSLTVTYKITSKEASLLPKIFWGAGVLFATSIAFIVSGAVVLLIMCLFRLADLSHEWDGDVIGQSLLLRERMADTRSREPWSKHDNDMPLLSDTFVLSSMNSSSN